jgi:4-hydroxythreonine-4-phosphate dehydrogenase
LNPHASDNGLIGNEENDLFKPLVKKLTRKGTRISGPIPADIALRDAAEGKYDACIACYHDQALIPLKLMDLPGVNLTAGLDFVRTSPAHGTAFDIAGRGIASPDSMEEAIRVAAQCTVRLKESMKC